MAITTKMQWTIRWPQAQEEKPLSERAKLLGYLAAQCDLQAAKKFGEARMQFENLAELVRDMQKEEMEAGDDWY